MALFLGLISKIKFKKEVFSEAGDSRQTSRYQNEGKRLFSIELSLSNQSGKTGGGLQSAKHAPSGANKLSIGLGQGVAP